MCLHSVPTIVFMKRNGKDKYLVLRRRTYYVRVRVPDSLRHRLPAILERSLKTHDLETARERKHAVVADFKGLIARAKRDPSPFEDLLHEAKRARDTEGAPEGFDYALDDFIAKHGELSDEQVAAVRHAFALLNNPSMVSVSEARDIYLTEKGDTIVPSSMNTKRRAIDAFIDWGGDRDVRSVDKGLCGRYVSEVIAPSKRAPKTKVDIVIALSSFWNWMDARGMATTNPWRGQAKSLPRDKRGRTDKRRGWNHAELRKFAEGIAVTDTLWSYFVLQLYTGCRAEEIASARLENVHADYLDIIEGKTPAAVRKIPWHPIAQPLVEHLKVTSADDRLLAGLKRAGVDRKYSHNIGARLGVWRRKLGITSAQTPGHALRNSFSAALLATGCPEALADYITGHEQRGLTYGRYAGAPAIELLAEQVQRVDFGEVGDIVTEGIRQLRGEP